MKANVRVQISGVKDSLMHLEARKDNTHPGETLFVTWCKVSDNPNRYHYGWQLMKNGMIASADGSASPVSHKELARDVQRLIENTFVDNTFQNVDQNDYLLTD